MIKQGAKLYSLPFYFVLAAVLVLSSSCEFKSDMVVSGIIEENGAKTESPFFEVTIRKSILENVGLCNFTQTNDPTNSVDMAYKITFSAPIEISSFTLSDISNIGTAGKVAWNPLENCGDNQNFRLTANSVSGDGTVIPFIGKDSIRSKDSLNNLESSGNNSSILYDTTPPSVTVNQHDGGDVGTCTGIPTQPDTTNAMINFKVAFSEAINASTFETSDITNAGSGGATALNWSIQNCGDDQNFVITTTAITGEGTIIPTLAAGVVADSFGNTNSISTATDNSVQYFSGASFTSVWRVGNGAYGDGDLTVTLPLRSGFTY